MTTDTVEIHHELEGPEDAPVLVLANSLGTTLAMWDDQAPELRERFRLLRYDHRGHGVRRSRRVRTDRGPRTRRAGAAGRVRDGSFSFCGLSIGGSRDVAGQRGSRARRASGTVCTSARFGPERGRSGPRRSGQTASGHRRRGTRALVHPAVPRQPAGHRRVGREMCARRPPRLRGLLRSDPGPGPAPQARRDRAPTLVIAGADDPATPPEHGELIRDGISGSSLVVVRRLRTWPTSSSPSGHAGVPDHLSPHRTEDDAMSDSAHDRGMKVRREVLGDDTSTRRSRARPTSPPTSRTSSPDTRGVRSGPARPGPQDA